VREDEELEVPRRAGQLVQAVKHVGQRPRLVEAAQREQRHAAQRDLGDDAQRADGDPGGEQLVAAVELVHVPSPATSWTASTAAEMFGSSAPVPCVPVEIAPAIDCTLTSPRFSRARPSSASRSLSAWMRMPACTRTRPGRAVGVEHASIASSESSVPVGDHRVGERVPGAGDPDHAAGLRGALDLGDDLGGRARSREDRGHARLLTGPVAPHVRSIPSAQADGAQRGVPGARGAQHRPRATAIHRTRPPRTPDQRPRTT
jgi:hypothetical protein